MTTSKPGKSPKPGTFQKGDDPRRNVAGNLNKAAQSYEIRFRNALASKLKPETFAAIVVEEVKRHRPGAKEFYADRLMGKVTQPIGGDLNINAKLSLVDFRKSWMEINAQR